MNWYRNHVVQLVPMSSFTLFPNLIVIFKIFHKLLLFFLSFQPFKRQFLTLKHEIMFLRTPVYELLLSEAAVTCPVWKQRPMSPRVYDVMMQIWQKYLWLMIHSSLNYAHAVSCCDICKIVTGLYHWNQNESKQNFHEILITSSENLCEMISIPQGPHRMCQTIPQGPLHQLKCHKAHTMLPEITTYQTAVGYM